MTEQYKAAHVARRGAGKIETAMSARATILLADDHVLLLEAFRRMLEPAYEVVGTAVPTGPRWSRRRCGSSPTWSWRTCRCRG